MKIGFKEQNFLKITKKQTKENKIEYKNKKICSQTIERISLKTALQAVWFQVASPTV